MLSFVYDFLQMISPYSATLVQNFQSAIDSIHSVIPVMQDFVNSCGFPPFVLGLFALIVSLCLFDKILEVLT